MKCLVNIVQDFLDSNGDNLVENFMVDSGAVANIGDRINTKKYSGIVKERVFDYQNIQYENPDHRGSVMVWLVCELTSKK